MVMDEVWKEFFTDHQTARALDSSEVFREYARAELARDELRKRAQAQNSMDARIQELNEIEEMNRKVASDPALKAKLRQARDYLEEHPEAVAGVDQNFVRGLSLLDLED
jgi:hypothetical protein